jgi:Zn-dependent protease with chaperone function
MVEQNQNQVICPNGHQQPNSNARFCIYCGTPLNVQPVQQQGFVPSPINPNPQVQNQPVQNQPVNNQPVQPNNWPAQTFQPQPPVVVPAFNPQPVQAMVPVNQVKLCGTCGGEGKTLSEKTLICRECKWLRPLAPGYGINPEAFQWAEDGRAMAVLRSITPLKMAAEVVSDKVGRRWIETMFNGVLLSDKQLPQVYFQAVHAARILGMSYMPDVYVTGELMWDCKTYGSDKDSFILVGSALATNFRGPELLFLFAREMGHCRTGHALWKTVIKFLVGEQRNRSGIMGGGLFSAIGKVLSPSALIEGTLEIPLMAWARQAEITADRAGMLVVGNEEIIRRVLLSWSLKSPLLQRQINVEEWLKQHAESDNEMTKLSELMTSSTPYITRRLKLIRDFSQSPELGRWQAIIKQYTAKAKSQDTSKKNDTDIRMKCATCGTAMRVPNKVLEGKSQLSIRCPDPKCGKMTYLKKKNNPAPKGDTISNKEQREIERSLNYAE